jgi:hypothetical protein
VASDDRFDERYIGWDLEHSMTHDNHHHHGQHDHQHARPKKRGLHTDWRAWVVVLLALAAMAMYVMSDDEAIQPGGGEIEERVPAAAE